MQLLIDNLSEEEVVILFVMLSKILNSMKKHVVIYGEDAELKAVDMLLSVKHETLQ